MDKFNIKLIALFLLLKTAEATINANLGEYDQPLAAQNKTYMANLDSEYEEGPKR